MEVVSDLGGGDWTTVKEVAAERVRIMLVVMLATGSNTNQAIAKFNYGIQGANRTGIAVIAANSTVTSQLIY